MKRQPQALGVRAGRTAIAVLILLLIGAAPASAHATLLFATPVPGGAVSESPRTLTLTFDSPVTLPTDPVSLTGLQGRVDALGASTLEDDGRTVQVAITDRIQRGLYTVTWQVISDDGEAVTGFYQFGVGSAANLSRSDFSPPNTPGAPVSAFLRWVTFAALAWLGGAWMLCLLVRKRGPYRPRTGLTFLACLLGAASAVGLRAIAVGAGDLGRGLLDLSVSTLTDGPGLVSLLEVASFVAAGALVLGRRREWLVLPVAVIVAAEAVRAHPRAADPLLGGAVTSVHLGALALWVGTLVHIVLFARTHHGHPQIPQGLWQAYARLALILVAAVIASGVAATLLLISVDDVLFTTYGRVLLAKLALVATALTLAAGARVKMASGRSPHRPALLEAGALVLILATSAALTVLGPPRLAASPVLLAPPPSGPVLTLGSRAGQIGLNLQASAGQLVVRLYTPAVSNQISQPTDGEAPVQIDSSQIDDSTQYRLGASVVAPDGESAKLQFKSCGTACFFSPTTWTRGTSVLTLTATASSWSGGETALVIPWPPTAGQDALKELMASLQTTSHLAIYEQVTSDTTQGPGPIRKIRVSGARFLKSEPFARGLATTANLVPSASAGDALLLGFPAEGVAVHLVLDSQGRPIRETLTAPNHLVQRTFAYPNTE